MNKWKVAVASVLAVGVLAGCGTSGNTSSVNTSSGNSTGGSSSGNVTIGFAVSTLNNPFFVAMRDGVQQEAQSKGVKVVVMNGNNDPSTQLNQVQDLIQQKVSAILLNPTDSEGLAQAVKMANDAHIPVITLDRSVSSGKSLHIYRIGQCAGW